MNRKRAFAHAFNGLWQAVKREVHVQLFSFIALLVILGAFYFSVTSGEWLALLACICLVLCLELFNSAIEKLCDMVMPQEHPQIKYIKDVLAGAVLLACLVSAIVGIVIFWKYLFA